MRQQSRQQFRQQFRQQERQQWHSGKGHIENKGQAHNRKKQESRRCRPPSVSPPTPSRRYPGTVPSGLTERNQRRLRCEHPKEFFFNKRAKNSLKLKRKFIRREWRYFKRNRLWDRANKAAKKLLKQQQPSSRTSQTDPDETCYVQG